MVCYSESYHLIQADKAKKGKNLDLLLHIILCVNIISIDRMKLEIKIMIKPSFISIYADVVAKTITGQLWF